MKSTRVADFMVNLAQCATVSRGATLYQAVRALETVSERLGNNTRHCGHREILITEDGDRVIGRIGPLALLKGLEPRYERVGDLSRLSRFGWSTGFVESIPQQFGLWESPLNELCRKAAETRVDAVMEAICEWDTIVGDASLDQAIHQMLMGRLQTLVVVEGDRTMGILRLSDVFAVVAGAIKRCNID